MTRKKPGPAKRGARKAATQQARKAVARKAPARQPRVLRKGAIEPDGTDDVITSTRTGYQVGAGNEGVTLPPHAVPPIV